MNRIPIESTNLKSVAYDPESNTLEVQFKNDRIYQYLNVPQVVFNTLMAVEDRGFYFRYTIRNSYEYREIQNETE